MNNSHIFKNLIWNKTLTATFAASCRKYLIIFENISGFAMKELATKGGLNKRKQIILKTLVCLKIKKFDLFSMKKIFIQKIAKY